MKPTLAIALAGATLLLTACFGGPPSNDTVKKLIEDSGKEAALAQANLFRARPLTDEEKEKLPNAFQEVEVSDCREDKESDSEYLCLVKMSVKSPFGTVVPVEEDVRIRKTKEGDWRLVANR